MFVFVIDRIVYKPDPDTHTLAYAEAAKKLEQSNYTIGTEKYKAVLASSVEVAVVRLRRQIQNVIDRQRRFDPAVNAADLSFTMRSNSVDDGEFWPLWGFVNDIEYPVKAEPKTGVSQSPEVGV